MAATSFRNIPTLVDNFPESSEIYLHLVPDGGDALLAGTRGTTLTRPWPSEDAESIINGYRTWLEEDETTVKGHQFLTPPSSPERSTSLPSSHVDSLTLDDVDMFISESGCLSGDHEEGEGAPLSPGVSSHLPPSTTPVSADEAVDMRTESASRGRYDSSSRADVYDLSPLQQVSPVPGAPAPGGTPEGVSLQNAFPSRLPHHQPRSPDNSSRRPLIPLSIQDDMPQSPRAANKLHLSSLDATDMHVVPEQGFGLPSEDLASLDTAERMHVVPQGVQEQGFALPSPDTHTDPVSRQIGVSTLLAHPSHLAPRVINEAMHQYVLPAASEHMNTHTAEPHAWNTLPDNTGQLPSPVPWHDVRLSSDSPHVASRSTVSPPGVQLEGDFGVTSREASASPELLPSPTTEAHRPKRKYVRKKPRAAPVLWEFLRNLLLDQRYSPAYVKWTNFEAGEFQIIKTGEVARLWGRVKGPTVSGKDMTYEKMSRALRHYYKQGIMSVVKDKRLVYSFGHRVLSGIQQRALQQRRVEYTEH